MSDSHLAYLSLGSNIQPEKNLIRAIERLQDHGNIEKISTAWESQSVGAEGPNYLNACLSFRAPVDSIQLKENIILPIEIELGRKRSENKFAPRTIDIDIVIFDDAPCDDRYWEQAFVMIPLSEIYPDYLNPLTRESILETATRLRKNFWMEARREILSPFHGSSFTA